jgi:hypothetical protein
MDEQKQWEAMRDMMKKSIERCVSDMERRMWERLLAEHEQQNPSKRGAA